MSEVKTLRMSSHGPHYLTPRSPMIEAGPIHGAFLNIENAANVVSEGIGPEGGRIECFGDRSPATGGIKVGLTLETGWRLLVTFKSPDHGEFRWTSFMFGDTDGEEGLVQFDTAATSYYFVTPAVSGSIPPNGPLSSFGIWAVNAAGNWTLQEMQLTAII